MISKKPAFTLIEILVVSTIIILLTTIGISSFSAANKSAKDAKRKTDLETVRQSMVLYKTQETSGQYPTGSYDQIVGSLIQSPTSKSYLSPPAPQDPGTTAYAVYNSSASTFCICATLDQPGKGNHNRSNCSGTWSANGGSGYDFYCVRQP